MTSPFFRLSARTKFLRPPTRTFAFAFAVAVALACGFAPACGAADPPAPTFANVTVHDPSIMRAADGTFYIYGSHLASAKSTDLISWTQISTSAAAGNALVPNPAVTFAEVLTWAQTTTFWAPDTIRLGDGRYYFYYDACRGDSPLSALGLAVSDSPAGPFTHEAVLLKSGMAGPSEDGTTYNATVHPNAVDPAVFFDQSGKLWMVYGSYSGGIFIMELDPSTGRQKPGQGYGKKLIGQNHSRIEGAYILYSAESNYYYLFMSFGGLAADGGYNVRLARSRQPDGPYLDAAGNDLTSIGGAHGTFFDDAAIAPYGVKLMGNYQFLTNSGEPGQSRGYVSPGHNSAYYDPATDQYFIVFHTRFVGRGEQHEVRVHPMFINDQDWLVVAPHRYAGEKITATDVGRVVGSYKLINHGKDITATVKPSTTINLLPDGTVSGAASGTWRLTADYDATLTLGGTAYHGVFVRQWDDDRSRWLLAFTAQASDGVNIWGSKVALDTAPAFVTAPAAQTVFAGAPVTFTALASGDPAPSYQWRKNGSNIPNATNPTFSLSAAATTDAADYSVVVTNAAGTATSPVAALVVKSAPSLITEHPASQTQPTGASASLHVAASGTGALTYQWFKNGTAIPSATTASLTFQALQTADAADYTVHVTAPQITSISRFARIVVAPPEDGRIANVSIRSIAGRNDQPLIIGMVVDGGSKAILIRAVGPTLSREYGVSGTMTDPILQVHATINANDTVTASNNDWADHGQAATLAATFATLGAFPLPQTTSRDAALITAVDGARTVHVNSTAPIQSGVVLVECYDATTTRSPRLVNVSARNFAGTGDQTLIAGFVVDGNRPKRLLIRGVGPTLASDYGLTGVLPNPFLEIHTKINGVDTVIATNDDWSTEPGVAAASTTAGAFPLTPNSLDAAIVITVPAGAYSVHLKDLAEATGEALVEVYELP